MTHKGHTASLGSAAEESDLDFVLAKLLGVVQDSVPRRLSAGVFVVLDCVDVRTEAGIRLDNASPAYLQEWDQGWTKIPGSENRLAMQVLAAPNDCR